MTSGGKPGWTARLLPRRQAGGDAAGSDDRLSVSSGPGELAGGRQGADRRLGRQRAEHRRRRRRRRRRVVWTGNVTADKTGMHKFRLYASSYVKVFADGKLVLDALAAELEPLVSTISSCR